MFSPSKLMDRSPAEYVLLMLLESSNSISLPESPSLDS